MHDSITIQGAREHNLRDISVQIPRGRLTVITGLSGSGKSSLAFDTLFAEGQRRYVESLSAYARQFLDQLRKPDVDHVEGLSPAIAIEQRSATPNPRSVVATTTELMDYLRLLYANAGQAHCPECDRPLSRLSAEQMVETLLECPAGTRIALHAPLLESGRGTLTDAIREARVAGYVRIRIDGEVMDLDEAPDHAPDGRTHTLDVVVDRLILREGVRGRLTDSVETALRQGRGVLKATIKPPGGKTVEHAWSEKNLCVVCGRAFERLTSQHFSFNSPSGACPTCGGLGHELYFDPELVVPDPARSLADGAVEPWRRGPKRLVGAYRLLLRSLADHAGVPTDCPWSDLPEAFRELVLNGSGETRIALDTTVRGSFRRRKAPFEGVLNNLRRRMAESPSESVRSMLRGYLARRRCSSCHGRRLRPESLACRVGTLGLMDWLEQPVSQALATIRTLDIPPAQRAVVGQVVDEIQRRLTFLDHVGVGYLTLSRESGSLSGGEMQRIRLATQIGSALTGVLYVLDEPTIGLHPRDTQQLIAQLQALQQRGNTVVVVEHDAAMIRAADHIIDLGPGAGRQGGQVVFEGALDALLKDANSLTGRYLAGTTCIPVPAHRHEPGTRRLRLEGVCANNLRDLTVEFPLGCLIAVTGVSGSGKSTLVDDVLCRLLRQHLATGARQSPSEPVSCRSAQGLEWIDKLVAIDQAPIGRTPRSNPATYTGAMTVLRELFAATPAAKSRGYSPGRFSFNLKGGRCEVCKGDGSIRLDMQFLPDVYVACRQCNGLRYNRETLEVRYGGRSIAEVLTLTVDEALDAFAAIPRLHRMLQTLQAVGLGYLQLGQSATTLSGGEAQRLKLASELQRTAAAHTLYLLDEPTTGLHFEDTRRLLEVLLRLRDRGHTVLVIEHNLDVIKVADHVIDLGPEGGDKGGRLVAAGPPETLAANPRSHTGAFLRTVLPQPAGPRAP